MVAASISFTIRIAVLVALFVGVFITVNNQVNSSRVIAVSSQLQKIGEYVETKIEYGLIALTQHQSNNSQYIYLPSLSDVIYSVELSCDNNLLITIDAETQRRYIINEFFNCSRIKAGGKVYRGDRCVYTRKVNETDINITLVSDCELV